MKYIVLIFNLLISSIALAQPAPDFKLDNPALAQKLSDLKGKVIYLDFWASWCAPCRKSFPWLNQIQAQYKDKGFTVIAVNVDVEKALATEFLAQIPANFPIVYDPEGNIANAYQLVGMPSSFIINKQGEIAVAHVGFHSKKIQQYQQEIEHLLNQK